mmetsp:Transcript_2611/g.5209  ORF Transcript_2611/g.5209 Transcript_2611/m.5209 type:complete len:305 (+) Transcript_2611:692-1606(+)
MREAHLYQLLRVQRPVVVAALADRTGKHHAGGVYRLPDVLLVHPSRDLFDQHRGEPLRSELFVHAQEVDLHHAHDGVVGLDARGDARDEAHKLAARLHAHAQVPMPQVLRRLQCPPEEGHGVIEAKHAVVILDVVLAQQRVDLLCLFIVVDVDSAPLERTRQAVGLVPDLLGLPHLVDRPAVLPVLGADGRHRLRVPEGVSPFPLAPRLFADARPPDDRQELLLAAQPVAAVASFLHTLCLLGRDGRRALGLALLLLFLLRSGLTGCRRFLALLRELLLLFRVRRLLGFLVRHVEFASALPLTC